VDVHPTLIQLLLGLGNYLVLLLAPVVVIGGLILAWTGAESVFQRLRRVP
jgi:predicted DNA repair protein MutK